MKTKQTDMATVQPMEESEPKFTLDEVYSIYIRWQAMAEEDRKDTGAPTSIKEFCDKYEIVPQDVATFNHRESFQGDLRTELLKWVNRKTPELVHKIYRQMKKAIPSVADARLWLEVAQMLKNPAQPDPFQNTTNNIINIFNPTDEQKRQILERATRRIALDGKGSTG